jgi:hypothetical protein
MVQLSLRIDDSLVMVLHVNTLFQANIPGVLMSTNNRVYKTKSSASLWQNLCPDMTLGHFNPLEHIKF